MKDMVCIKCAQPVELGGDIPILSCDCWSCLECHPNDYSPYWTTIGCSLAPDQHCTITILQLVALASMLIIILSVLIYSIGRMGGCFTL